MDKIKQDTSSEIRVYTSIHFQQLHTLAQFMRNAIFSYLFITFSVLLLACRNSGDTKNNITAYTKNRVLLKDTSAIKQLLRISDLAKDSIKRINYIRQALNRSFEVHYNDGIVQSIFYLTAFFFEKGQFDSCSKYYDLAYDYARHPDFRKDLLSALYLNHGTFYYLQGDYVSADSLYYLGLQSTNDSSLASNRFLILYNLQFTKRLTGQKDNALSYIDQAKKLAADMHDTADMRMSLIAESDFYSEEKDMAKAKTSLENSFVVYRGDTTLDQWYIYANVLAAGNEPEKAIPVLKRAIQKATGNGVDFTTLSLRTQLGVAYNKAGKYDLAVQILEPVMQETLQKKFNYNSSDVYTALETAYEHLGNYEKALIINKDRNAINDSLLNIDKIKGMNELDLKYKTAEKDKMIALDKLKIVDQHNRINLQTKWIVLISAATLLVIAAFLAYSRLKKQQIVYLKQQQEIDKLKARIQGEENERQRLARELHDGVGSLLSSAIMHTNQLEVVAPDIKKSEIFHSIKNILTDAAVELRKSANNLIPEPVVNLGLAEAILQFCISTQKPYTAAVNVQVYGDLDSLELPLQLTIYRMVQELVHNAMKHSNAEKVLVQISRLHDQIEITVEDNGKGLESNSSHQGMGLKNLHSRVEELRGKLSIKTEPDDGTAINIELPVLY